MPESAIDPSTAPTPRERRNPVTVNDVARLANVSTMTVSRALNSPHLLSEATLAVVRDAVAKTGYVPNLLATTFRKNGQSRMVAALVPSLAGGVFAETVQFLTAALHRRGYQVMLGETGFDEAGEDAMLSAMIGRRPDGIVLTGILHSTAGRRQLLTSGIPVVETWDLTPTPIDMLVGFSHTRVGEDACAFLIRRGYGRLGIVMGHDDRARRRVEGFTRHASRAGLPAPVVEIVPSPTTHADGRQAFAALLSRAPELDAVFCGSDTLALGALSEAAARSIQVPGQVAIMGHGDVNFAATLHPSLTTVRIEYQRMAETAANFILDRAEGRPIEDRVVDLGFSIVQRDSA